MSLRVQIIKSVKMLTVKKFLFTLDLSFGGYAAGLFGIIWALLTIFEFPPDLDLQGKFPNIN